MKHILLTALGVRSEEAHYILDGNVYTAKLSPIALMHLLPREERPHKIIALCTAKALEETFPILENAVDVPVESVKTPEGRDKEELWQILRVILAQIPAGSKVTLELTQGLRPYPFLFFTAALFLKALREVDIGAVYYGMLEVKKRTEDGLKVSSIVDLYPVLEMIEWFYATRMFKETGQAHLLSKCLAAFERPPAGLVGEECREYARVKVLRKSIDDVAMQYAQSLPLKMGLQINDLKRKLSGSVPDHLEAAMPVPGEIFDEIRTFVEPFVIPGGEKKNKKELVLEDGELVRQAAIIDTYLERGFMNYALGLMREWIISAVMWHRGGLNVENWLKTKGKYSRGAAERRLGAMALMLKVQRDILKENQVWLAGHWQFLSSCRNMVHHHGFREENVFLKPDKIERIKQSWTELKNNFRTEKWDVEIAGGGGTLLVSPLGLSRGLLYSALKQVDPDQLLVITSREMVEHLDEIILKAGWKGDISTQIMEDPHRGFDEAKKIAKNSAALLLKADHVRINITGGATALQYTVQQIYQQAGKLDREVSQVALVDRRPVREQADNPYVLGELIELEKDEDDK